MTMIYEVPDELALQEWFASTFIVSSASNAEELYSSATPIKQATLYYIPKSGELLLLAPHHMLDGKGMLLLCHNYLNALTTPSQNITLKFGDEYTRLAPAIEEVLGFPKQPTSEQAEKALSIAMSYASSLPGIGPVSKVGQVPPGRCQSTELVFSTQTTEMIIKACKNNSITVTSAIHAAYIQAIVKYADPNSHRSRYANSATFDLRPHLPEPYSTSQYAASVYFTPYPLIIDLLPFWESAHTLNKYYQTTIKDDPEFLELNGHIMRVMLNAIQTPEFQAIPISGDAIVSRMGVAERYVQRAYGNMTVRDIRMGVDVLLGPSVLFVYTFQDQLRLAYSFNDGYEDPTKIDSYLKEIERVLVEELLG
ncbi:hypothetical protein BO94DRAFT_538955 [Aspergillus sclerotioniger CBS 115572]|uniref:CoA-dependent acyltransferase n=1 Tax=Aspergillus sclerotioniger CBS 115572 TaxID=1450535 RepID=A0A317VFB9_9EURO|nr:hypothetical protein BO94DRAFT_538955 [Aspergillus sclerotioniger CBS 115572]PWY73074.1 hypothetical protein BO94DRAFT_538955 [Aspergillus sclerotioniger CBS 115572]